jgi:Tfp pilus assembly protein PilF
MAKKKKAARGQHGGQAAGAQRSGQPAGSQRAGQAPSVGGRHVVADAGAPPSPPQQPARLTWPRLAGIAALAFAVRAAVALSLGRTVLYRFPQLDSREFLNWAQKIAAGDFTWPLFPTHGPGYSYLLGALLALSGGSFTAVRLVQAAMGALLCVLTALLAARLCDDRRAGLAAGLLLALYGPLVYVETSFLAEGLLILLLVAALWLLLRAPREEPLPPWAAAAAGLLLGLAAVTRATALLLVPALVLALFLDRRRPRRALAAALLATGALAVVLPVLVHLRRASGDWVPIQAYGGLNLYMGNRPGAPGVPTARLGGDWDRLSGEAARRGIATVAAQDRWYNRRALGEIAAHPLAWLRVVGRKALWLVQDEEIRESHSFYFFRAQSRLLAALPGFALLFSLALCGLVLAAARRAPPPVVVAYLLVFTVTCVGIVVSSRYRLPMVPVLAAYAGGAAVWLAETLAARRWRTATPYLALVVVAFALTQLRDHAPSRNLAEEWSLTAASLEAQDDLAGARAALGEALRADPRSALARSVAGRLAEREGDFAAAEREYAAAARLAPGYQRAHLNLGAALKRRGDLDGARRELERALWLVPGHPAALRELGDVLLAKGDVEGARRVYRQLVAAEPRNPAGYVALARLEGAARNPAKGVELAATAARLDPAQPEPWLMLAMLAVDAGNAAAARDALEHAAGLLGPEAPPVAFGWALLDRLEGRPAAAEERLRGILARHPDYEPARRLLAAGAGAPGSGP